MGLVRQSQYSHSRPSHSCMCKAGLRRSHAAIEHGLPRQDQRHLDAARRSGHQRLQKLRVGREVGPAPVDQRQRSGKPSPGRACEASGAQMTSR